MFGGGLDKRINKLNNKYFYLLHIFNIFINHRWTAFKK